MKRNNDWARVRIEGDWCVYCGDVANTVDHFPPRSVTFRGYLLPCCRWCNSKLGNRFPNSIEERELLIKKSLARKVRRMRGDWTNSEIEEELTGNLQRMVKLWQGQKRSLRSRIAWSAMKYLRLIAPDKSFAARHTECDGMPSSVKRD